MKFKKCDKYIYDYLMPKIRESEKYYKEALKNSYLRLNDIYKEAKVVNSDEAMKLIKNNDSFVAGVNYFNNSKTDFYLLSQNGITIPISTKNKLIIKDKELLEKELCSMGFMDAMKIELKSKDEILSSPYSYEKYRIKKNMSTQEIKEKIETYTSLELMVKKNSYYKINKLDEEDLQFVLSKASNTPKQKFAEVINLMIRSEDEALGLLEDKGFENLRKLSEIKEFVKNRLQIMSSDLFIINQLYTKVEYEKLEMPPLDYSRKLDFPSTFVEVAFDEKKIKQIIQKEHLESVDYIKEAEVKIGKPIISIEEYENYLKIEEYIKKTTTKKIEMDINNIPTLDEIFEKEFDMKR